MEVGSPANSAGSRRGGGDREEAARGSGGAMRARVCARVRTPHGVGALLLVGGAIVGAAVVAWRHWGDRKNAKNRRRHKEEEEEKVPVGGVVENEQGNFDKSDENLSRGDTEVEASGLDGEKTEDLHVNEIVADELDSELADKFDPNSSRERTEVITGHDQNSSKSGIEKKVTPNATEGVENSDEGTLTISSPEIVHEEHNGHDDDADEETVSTKNTPITQMTVHQPQISEELKVDNITETTTLYNVSKHEEQKPLAQDPVAPVDSPACSSLPSLLKTAQNKRPVNPGQTEKGMKLGQDGSNGELRNGGTTQGVSTVTMNRRATPMAILAIIFALTIGLNLFARLYSTLQAT